MGRLLLPDSSFYLRLTRMRRDPFVVLAGRLDDWEPAICGIVWAEVLRGRIQASVRDRFTEAFSLMAPLEMTARVWCRTAELARELDRAGCVLGLSDLTIAACALEYDAVVWTFDQHFDLIPGLTVLNELPV